MRQNKSSFQLSHRTLQKIQFKHKQAEWNSDQTKKEEWNSGRKKRPLGEKGDDLEENQLQQITREGEDDAENDLN